ncbi:MAG: tyrosine-type recombinase/integrase [Bacteroidales bacterium]|nr:tyrosine-type recombinase/integrase [Bacteroidales bacterium]
MKVQEAIEKFLIYCQKEKNLSMKTLKAYSIDLNQLELYLSVNNIRVIEDVEKDEIKGYLHKLSSFAPKTIKRKIATAKVFFNYHEFDETIQVNPFRKVRATIRIPAQLPKVMTLQQVEKILSTAYKAKDKVKQTETYTFAERLRDIAVLELLFATGIRVSELCNLKLQNIDTDFTIITVNGKGSKERNIPIPNEEVKNSLITYYYRFESVINEYFFVNRLKQKLSEQSVRHMVRKHSIKAQIPKHITPHIFRHTFATLLLEQDVDIRYIQNILGHSSINTTQIYTHVNNKKKCEILTQKHPRNGMNM